MTKIAEAEPFFCAACHGRPEGARYIDFEAYYDGPVINEDGIKLTIDDLVICDQCLGAAARLIGFVEASDDRTAVENRDLKASNLKLSKIVASQNKAVESTRKALDAALNIHSAA